MTYEEVSTSELVRRIANLLVRVQMLEEEVKKIKEMKVKKQ